MHDTGTVLNSNIVAEDYTECLLRSLLPVALLVSLNRLNPWQELLVAHALEIRSLPLTNYLEWDNLVARVVAIQRKLLALLVED